MIDNTTWMAALEARVLRHPVGIHPLYRAFQHKTVTFDQLRVFGLAYYPVVMRIHLFQAQAIAVLQDVNAQCALAASVDAACGSGRPHHSNIQRYRVFLRSLGYGSRDWNNPPVVGSLRSFALVHRALCCGDPLGAVGASSFALQWPHPSFCEAIAGVLDQHSRCADSAVFFREMGKRAGLGAEGMARAIRPILGDPTNRIRLEDGVLASLDVQHVLLDGIWAAMCHASISRSVGGQEIVC